MKEVFKSLGITVLPVAIVSYLLFQSLIAPLIILSTIGVYLFFYFKNNIDRKESLSIYYKEKESKVYFLLSGDDYFNSSIDKTKSISQNIFDIVKKEILSIGSTIDRVSLVGIEDNKLLKNLNTLIYTQHKI